MRGSGFSAAVLRQMLDAVDPAGHDGDGMFVPDTVLVALGELIGAEQVTFQEMNTGRRQLEEQNLHEDCDENIPAEMMDLFWQAFWDCRACCHPQRTGDYTTIVRLSDFYSRTEVARTVMGSLLALSNVRHYLTVPLPPEGECDRRILMFRTAGPDFNDRDILALHLLRPHLTALHRRQRRHAAGAPELTPRQQQILTLVADGHTNHHIARVLNLSEATVRKHLENAYARLGVTNRTAAAIKVLPQAR